VLKYLNSLRRIRDGKNSDPGGKNSDPGFGINIPDPKHRSQHTIYNTEMRAVASICMVNNCRIKIERKVVKFK
jgi:hypothetical protein